MAIDQINWGYGSRAALKRVEAREAERVRREQQRLLDQSARSAAEPPTSGEGVKPS